jgi:hypothetical protein
MGHSLGGNLIRIDQDDFVDPGALWKRQSRRRQACKPTEPVEQNAAGRFLRSGIKLRQSGRCASKNETKQ